MEIGFDFETEILIVGGGPAGVSTAFTLGKDGKKTILIDKKPYDRIGDKVCGDALSPFYTELANDQIGLPLPNDSNGELSELCDSAVLVGKSKDSILNLGSRSATVDRHLYGQALIKSLSQFDSVQVMSETRVKEAIVSNNRLIGLVCISAEKGEIRIQANCVVDASGSSGIVRKRLPAQMCAKFPRKIPKHQMLVAYREIIKTSKPHNYRNKLYLTYEPEIEDIMPGYYWYFSKGEKLLNIGLGYLLEDHNIGKNIKEINEKVRKRVFPDAEVIASQGDQIPSRLPLPSCVHNGFLAVGDAAAMANPLNGEGHGIALLAGIQAGKNLIQSNNYTEEELWDYNKWVWNQFGVEFSWGIAIVKFVRKFGIDTFDWLMRKNILQEDDILTMINNPEENINIVERAMRGWYKPKVLLGLRKTMNLAKQIQEHSKNYPSIDNFDKWYDKLSYLENYKI